MLRLHCAFGVHFRRDGVSSTYSRKIMVCTSLDLGVAPGKQRTLFIEFASGSDQIACVWLCCAKQGILYAVRKVPFLWLKGSGYGLL